MGRKRVVILLKLFMFTLITTLAAAERTPCLITIFVHGTLKPAEITLASLQQMANDQVKNTLYAKIVELMRPNLHFHRSQAMQEIGLQPITEPEKECRTGAHCIVAVFEQLFKQYDCPYPLRRYYTFGWNGLLSIKERKQEAAKFYQAIIKLVEQLHAENLEPIIDIFAFSHGGNVTLNLAAIKKERGDQAPFTINTLVLLATPIQRETDFLVQDKAFFKKVYHFYSTEDHIQPSDVFSTKKEFSSNRTFRSRHNCKLPDSLTQVRFRLTSSYQRLQEHEIDPSAPYRSLLHKHIRFKHMDPAHTEFWSIQWGDYRYRTNLPLYPLPVVAYAPLIIKILTKEAPHACHVTFDYCPKLSGARIILHHPKKMVAVPMPDPAEREAMQLEALSCKPTNYSIEADHKEEKEAFREARELITKNKSFTYLTIKKLRTAYISLSKVLWPKYPKKG